MVPKIQNILFATDLTESSRHAFRYAGSLAAVYGGSVTALHVLEKLPPGIRQRFELVEGQAGLTKLREAHEKGARDVLINKRREDSRIRNDLAEFYGWPTQAGPADDALQVVLTEGEVADEILRVAEEKGCELIVMGAHTGMWGTTVLGRAAKSVLQRAKVPVLVVPPAV